ncbi:hypothetical protein DRQ50_07605 [bacterium]|nr:MAG: hypothetical protein DRQ50_07605 [bacterium]
MRNAILLACLCSAVISCSPDEHEQIVVQVEDLAGPWRHQTNIFGYLAGGFCTSNANPDTATTVMQAEVQIPAAGDYAIWMRAYTSPGGKRALQVEVDGKLLPPTHAGNLRRWSWEKAGEVELPLGAVQLVIHDADDGFETADAVLLTGDLRLDLSRGDKLWSFYPDSLPARADPLRFNIDACLAQSRRFLPPVDEEHWQNRRGQVEAALRSALDFTPTPVRTPLAAVVTGRTQHDGYRVENIVYQSLPRFYVSANLWIPDGVDLPAPAVIVTMGHAMREGKNYGAYRAAQLGFVRRGFVVLGYDPIGQGERHRWGYTHQLGYAALLCGRSNLHYMVLESVRALDYLVSRTEVDPERIGIAGNSGGGLNAMYTMPMEPRLAAAGAFSSVCSLEDWIRAGGYHCICSHLPGLASAMEEFELIALNRPRPFLAGHCLEDAIFPVSGTRQTVARARGIYALSHAGGQIRLAEVPGKHGWRPPLREAGYGWMMRHLQGQGDGSPSPEAAMPAGDLQAPEWLSFKSGSMPEDALTYADLVAARVEQCLARLPAVPEEAEPLRAWQERTRRLLWETLGGRPAHQPTGQLLARFELPRMELGRIALHTEPSLEIPGVLMTSRHVEATGTAMIYLDDGGKEVARFSPLVRSWLDEGRAVFALDVRGLGETTVMPDQIAADAVLLGRPLLAQQAWDIICAAKYLRTLGFRQVGVVGNGRVGLIALTAAALSAEIDAVATRGSILGFRRTVADPLPEPLWTYASNILRVADVPHLAALVAPRPLLMVNPTVGGRPLAARRIDQQIEPILRAYRGAAAEGRGTVLSSDDAATILSAFPSGW